METRTLGRTNITVPVLGAGCWAIGGPAENLGMPMGWSTVNEGQASLALREAYDRGVRLFDTADAYGLGRSERLIGALVNEVGRDHLYLSSKVGYFVGTAPHGYHPLHMKHQLEQTLDNLNTDYLDIYFFHNNNFGLNDELLDEALSWMADMRRSGVIRSLGMRAPHRYAVERLRGDLVDDKEAHFWRLVTRVRPDVLAVRDNLLSPDSRLERLYEWAAGEGCGVLINKPLAQGLLTGKYDGACEPTFGAGDHRVRKSWFHQPHLTIVSRAVREVAELVGNDRARLINLALWACLEKYANAVVLCGFTTPQQVAQNVAAVEMGPPLDAQLEAARAILQAAHRRLAELGGMFEPSPGTESAR
jgi:methylglyoxal reductase